MTDEDKAKPIEGELIPAGVKPTSTDDLDKDAIELGRADRGGRPSDMTPEVVTKLIAAFHNGYNITEACYYAEISRTTYYRWLENDDKFSYKMSVAQSALGSKAKASLAVAINAGDPAISLRFLMLRDPDFKPKVDAGGGQDVTEARNNLKGVLDAIGSYDPSSEPTAAAKPDNLRVVADDPTDIS